MRPALSRSSTSLRAARASEPWCERTSGSPASSFSAPASRSARRRLLTKSSVELVRSNQLEQPRMNRRPDRRRATGPLRGGPTRHDRRPRPVGPCLRPAPRSAARAAFFSDGVDDGDRAIGRRPCRSSVNSSWSSASTSSTGCTSRFRDDAGLRWARLRARRARLGAAEKPRHFVERALRRREADALQRSRSGRARSAPVAAKRLESLERQREVRASLAGHERVNLVDDDGVDRRQPLAGVRREQQEQRLGRGDQNVGRFAPKPRALDCGRVAGANRDLRHGDATPVRPRHVRDAGQRRAQVALDVDRQRLERRDVEHAAARSFAVAPASNISRLRHQRKAASVLPLPVGARMSVDSPRAIAGHPSCCGRVGAGNARLNHSRTAGWKGRALAAAIHD